MFVWIVREFKVSYCIRYFTNTVRIIEVNKNTLYRAAADLRKGHPLPPHPPPPSKINKNEPGKKRWGAEIRDFRTVIIRSICDTSLSPKYHYFQNYFCLYFFYLYLFKSRFLSSFFRPFKQRDVSVKCYPIHMYLIILSFRETYFSRFKKFREIKVPPKKGAAKIKDGKFSDLYENLYLSFPSARNSVLGGGSNFSSAYVLIPHYLTHLAKLGPVFAILPQHSLQTCHQHILFKAQICLQLGIWLKFRNKWNQGTALMRLRSI